MGKNARCFGQDLMRGEHVVGGGGMVDTKSITNNDNLMADGTRFGGSVQQSGTSIFDPVLCEVAYRWFCPPGGVVLDPFAGGSVRGIVAGMLGRSYVGIDLREEQIAANRIQWDRIKGDANEPVEVKVSAKSMRQMFRPCDPVFIRDVCHASCCESSTSDSGTLITIHPSEQDRIIEIGGKVEDGLLVPRDGERKCSFKTDENLCGLHGTGDKPFGCIASPFTLNSHNTLIVRNRYRMLKCHKAEGAIEVYKAHPESLKIVLGEDVAAVVTEHFDQGGGDIVVEVDPATVSMIRENDQIKKGKHTGDGSVRWICGDSRNTESLLDDDTRADFVFTCPPYADLEVYSDDPRDISTMSYDDFTEAYREIIKLSCDRLKPDRFACIVVGDVRDKAGNYRNFVGDTISAFLDAGLSLYNDAILVTALGSLPIRAGRQFMAGRKLGKTHQNVLVFLKGDAKKATEAIGEVEAGEVPEPDGEGEWVTGSELPRHHTGTIRGSDQG